MVSSPSPDDDADLMLRTGAGDAAAFELLVQRHKKRVINTVYRFLGNTEEAEDLAQDVFLNLYRSAPRYEPQAKFTTYLYRLVANRCLNHARRMKIVRFFSLSGSTTSHAPTVAPIDPPSPEPAPEETAERRQEAEMVNRAVARLPARQRMAVILRHYQDMKYAEIGEALSMSIPAVKSVLHRGLETLREKLRGRIP